jgi:hypothetical protein
MTWLDIVVSVYGFVSDKFTAVGFLVVYIVAIPRS